MFLTSTHRMSRCVYFVALLFIASEGRKPDNPLQGRSLVNLPKSVISRSLFIYLGTSSVCADVCTSAEAHVELDLTEARIYRHHEQVQITLHPTGSGRCREPGRRGLWVAISSAPIEKSATELVGQRPLFEYFCTRGKSSLIASIHTMRIRRKCEGKDMSGWK